MSVDETLMCSFQVWRTELITFRETNLFRLVVSDYNDTIYGSHIDSCSDGRILIVKFFFFKPMKLEFTVCVCRSNWLLLCPSHRSWSQQIRNYILTVLGEEWDQGGRSPLREIQPRPPRPRNNTHWVHFPQPATPCWPNASFFCCCFISPPLPPKPLSPLSPNGNKETNCPGFNHVFSL